MLLLLGKQSLFVQLLTLNPRLASVACKTLKSKYYVLQLFDLIAV